MIPHFDLSNSINKVDATRNALLQATNNFSYYLQYPQQIRNVKEESFGIAYLHIDYCLFAYC